MRKLIILLIALWIGSCKQREPSMDKADVEVEESIPPRVYRISYTSGKYPVTDASTGPIKFMDNGCISYESFNHGRPDSVIVCGTFQISKW